MNRQEYQQPENCSELNRVPSFFRCFYQLVTSCVGLFLFTVPLCVVGQHTFRLSGYIQEAGSEEGLVGATIFAPSVHTGASTNGYGYFSLLLPAGNNQLTIQYVGYQSVEVSFDLLSDSLVHFYLEAGLAINEVQVSGKSCQSHPELSSLSYHRLNLLQMKRMPSFLGETDVLKALQYLPGVKGGRENTAGFNVRGGSGDQNQILLDGAPVYNIYHAFGFFSTFNSHAIKDVAFYKGGIPARYGGKLSSVLDVTTREGNMKKAIGVFSVSPVSGQFNFEAPVKKDTASFFVALRRSYIDLPMVFFEKAVDLKQTYGYKFYDFNAKGNWIIDEKNRLYLSLYSGRDRQFYRSDDGGTHIRSHYQWGNFTSVFRWNRLFSPDLFANFSIYASQYRYEQNSQNRTDDDFTRFKTSSQLRDYSCKTDFEYYPVSNHTLRWGSQFSYLKFAPGIFQVKSNNFTSDYNQKNQNRAGLAAVYAEDYWKVNRFSINGGIRLSAYLHQGYCSLYVQPRLAVSYELGNSSSLTVSYMLMSQHLHLLTNSSMGLPTDLWVGSTSKIKPEEGHQVSLGWEKKINSAYQTGIETYYKTMKHVIRFKEGESFMDTKGNCWENSLLTGKGRAYGLECFVEKQKGHFTWMFSYTLSKSERQFDQVNKGHWFPFKYDRRHDFSLHGAYQLPAASGTERNISFGFTLQSGNHLSIPDSEIPGLLLPGFKDEWFTTRKTYFHPNNLKMPTFHHLDLGYSSTKKLGGNKSRTWSFSVYNVYNRLNPWYYYKKEREVRKVSVFPIIPSVAFTYSF